MIVTLYHGTSSKHLDSIKKNGLKPRIDSGNYGDHNQSHRYVYLTRYYPAFFALNALKSDDEMPVIVRIEINIAELLPDEDFLAQVQLKGDRSDMSALHKAAREMDPIDYSHLAKASYEMMGNVCVEQVPREFITHIVELPTKNIFELAHLGADTNYSACVGPLSEIVGGRYVNRLEILCKQGWEAVLNDIKLEQEKFNEMFKEAKLRTEEHLKNPVIEHIMNSSRPKEISKLKKSGREYLNALVAHCPSKNEQEFNTWIMGQGFKYRLRTNLDDERKNRLHSSQMTLVDEWFTMYLNSKARK